MYSDQLNALADLRDNQYQNVGAATSSELITQRQSNEKVKENAGKIPV
jgi:hypothetical protein